MVIRTGDHPAGTIRLAEDQMEELRELLRPGHKMASIMLDQHIASQESRYGGENAGSMDPGPQITGDAAGVPAVDDTSKLGGEGDNMGSGTDATGDGGAPGIDDPSKQGGG